MPTYDYECDACHHTFEEFQSMSDEHLKKCPKCGKKKLRRLLGAGAAIIFKGSGFYQTDYRSDSYKSRPRRMRPRRPPRPRNAPRNAHAIQPRQPKSPPRRSRPRRFHGENRQVNQGSCR